MQISDTMQTCHDLSEKCRHISDSPANRQARAASGSPRLPYGDLPARTRVFVPDLPRYQSAEICGRAPGYAGVIRLRRAPFTPERIKEAVGVPT